MALALGVQLLLGALAVSHGFNLDLEEPIVFRDNETSFGQTVVQFGGSRLVVGAPLQVVAANQTGQLYDCVPATGSCQPISLHIPTEFVNMSLGLSLATSMNQSQVLACGPTVHRACGENTYAKGSCLLLDSRLQIIWTFPEDLPDCPHHEMDIAFLIDGSGSIEQSDFSQMKDFVRAVMGQFQGTNTMFSLMQYSNILKTHFTFTEFRTSLSPQSLVDPIMQLRGLTFTATGILQVVKELFHSKNGARQSAKKVLIVITDGQKYRDPLDYPEVIPQAEEAGILRYAIGVGDAFQEPSARLELDAIGSAPPQDHVFKVGSFTALGSIQKQLQEKIFAVEGTRSRASSSFQHEMSQEGFSSVFTADGPVLGAVGSFSWSGGAFLHSPSRAATFINMSKESMDMRDAYLGYSTQVALWKGARSLVMGAPRYQHTGKVVMFTQESGQWQPNAEVTGTQIGSYFGASLCSVDVNGDGNTDLILIGAPHYYEQTRGGQVSVCPMPRGRAPWRCGSVLRGEQGHPWGRFGAALTVLGDVNWDKLTDVAVGAPGEQENQGAVYIFHGTPGLGLGPAHSQRIPGSQLSSGLQYFGQSLSGGQDLTRDGLVDLAVGAQGHMVLLRSLPVLKVGVSMRFVPVEVAKTVYQCWGEALPPLEAGEATICLTIHKGSFDHLDAIQSSIRYDLALDPGRLVSRAIFHETKNWTLTRRKTLGLGEHCESVKLLLPDCVEDVGSPVILRLNFSLVEDPSSFWNLRPVLAMGSQDLFTASLPFEKNCGPDHICEGDLGVNYSFSGLQTLMVGSCPELNLTVTVWNEGEDSYGTVVTFYYPAGLAYRWASGTQGPHQHPLRLACEAEPIQKEGLRSSRCNINHPIFREGTKATFVITFDVSHEANLGDRLLIRASASSKNNKPATHKTSFGLALPVKYMVFTVISRQEDSTKYFNFSFLDKETTKEAKHRYRVNNLSWRDLAVSITFWVPVLLNDVAVWAVAVKAPAQSLPCVSERELPQHSNFLTQIPTTSVLNCSIADCLKFRCDIPSFGIQEQLDFLLQGNLSFGWVSKTLQKKVLVTTVAEITFDTAVYSQLPGQEAFLRAQMETVLEEIQVYHPTFLVVGSSAGGLLLLALITAALYKLGFFRRHYKEMLDVKTEDPAPCTGDDVSCEAPDLPSF
ncbi:integrin alpha-D-like [Perognathus longimembris pacificus]|uniref:integrin alpha-D-like n=1 Tax=Perognathus longimembris pacificus TaxID=214514 RepID=UPI002018775F|nr:integrin alpha-D-like [Perognathus longimembris pacificus]